jgi:hypothetical protein
MPVSREEKLQLDCLTVRHLFWEFYAQNHLWFMLGSGKETYGYKTETIFPHRLVEKVDSRFDKLVEDFFNLIKVHLEMSIRSEMKYVFRPKVGDFIDAVDLSRFGKNEDEFGDEFGDLSLIVRRASDDLREYLRKQNVEINRSVSHQTAPIEWARVAFDWAGWSNSYCGPFWAHACDVLLDANHFKTNLKEKIFWIDSCLDLYHNNGFLMNKTAFAALEAANDLDIRSKIRNWAEVIEKNQEIRRLVMIGNKWDDEIEIKQRRYPLSKTTENLILRYANKI